MQRLKKACLWLLPVAVLSGCGVEAEDAPETVGTSAQGVLYAPPAPASGNILDSTTYMGPVAVPGAVQTRFTTNPQYFSFSLNVQAGAQVKLEVTHLGSSMYLDTGLFVYGPKNASGSYGTTVLAQDDDAGYGQLSKVAGVTLAQGGEYLVVVSSGTGSGKQFRLQVDCLNGTCAQLPPPPANYSLALSEQTLPSHLQSQLTDGNEAVDYTWAELRPFHFSWPYSGAPSLDKAAEAVLGFQEYEAFTYDTTPEVYSYADFHLYLYTEFEPLHASILSTYGNGTETVQVKHYYYDRPVAPGASGWFHLYVILFPESRKVVVFEQNAYET
jgi:hypothetical protein